MDNYDNKLLATDTTTLRSQIDRMIKEYNNLIQASQQVERQKSEYLLLVTYLGPEEDRDKADLARLTALNKEKKSLLAEASKIEKRITKAEEALKEAEAAVIIQSVARGRTGRASAAEAKEAKEAEESVKAVMAAVKAAAKDRAEFDKKLSKISEEFNQSLSDLTKETGEKVFVELNYNLVRKKSNFLQTVDAGNLDDETEKFYAECRKLIEKDKNRINLNPTIAERFNNVLTTFINAVKLLFKSIAMAATAVVGRGVAKKENREELKRDFLSLTKSKKDKATDKLISRMKKP